MSTPAKRSHQLRGVKNAARKRAGLPRQPHRADSAPTPTTVLAVQRLFDMIPDDELRAALEASDDDRALRLLTILDDPAYRNAVTQRYNMAACIRGAGMTVADALKAITTMHSVDADLRVMRRLPAIMEQMAAEAAPRLVACPKCQPSALSVEEAIAAATAETLADSGTDSAGTRCRGCRGRGVIIRDADNDVRKMLLETQNKLGRVGPLVDARAVHLHGGGRAAVSAPDMTDWSRSTDAAFEERTPQRAIAASTSSVEAELVEGGDA